MRLRMVTSLLAVALGLSAAGLAMAADTPAVPTTAAATTTSAQAVVISTSDSLYETRPTAGCDACAPKTKLGAKVQAHFSKPRPPQDCPGCSTWRCEWRFLWSGCRGFFDQGRFQAIGP